MALKLRTSRPWATVALASALAWPLVAAAQQRPTGPPPYTPAPNAKDLKSVLFNWGWHMVQLRGLDEHELAVSLEYTGKGTVQVEGQPCTLTRYRSSTNYQTPGQRIQYTCTRANGQAYSTIEVVSGQYAWNEDLPGAEIVSGKGKATPRPNAVQERLIRLWAGPQAALKAALAGAGIPLLATDRNPGQLLAAGKSKLGETSVEWKGGKPVVTFPVPGVAGATAVAAGSPPSGAGTGAGGGGVETAVRRASSSSRILETRMFVSSTRSRTARVSLPSSSMETF